MPRIFLSLAAAVLVLLPGQRQAQADQPGGRVLTIRDATIGFGGRFKSGFWQPVRLTVVAGSGGARGRLELLGLDGDQVPVAYRDEAAGEIDLKAEEETTLQLYFKSGPIATPIRARLIDNGAAVWSDEVRVSAPALPSTQHLVVQIGAAMGIEEAAATIRRRADSALAIARVSAMAELPDRWWGYDGVDTLVLATSDAALLETMNGDQKQAIVQWVLLGGRIILCAGKRGAEIAAAESPWSPLIPGQVSDVEPLRERSGLEEATKSELPFNEEQFQRNRPYITRLKNARGEVLVEEVSGSAGRPLVVHAPVGLGQVIFVGIDLDHPSLKDWKGRTRLAAMLLARASQQQGAEAETRAGIRQLGYEDLIGQLRTALDQFPGVSLVSFTTVATLTIVYLLLIGPGDYLLLSRLKLPRHVTWLTFSLLAIGTLAVGMSLDRQTHGHKARLNEAEVIDIDLEQQMARGMAWCHVYSPATELYNARLTGRTPPNLGSWCDGWVGWQGLPGDSLGGLESRQPAIIQHEPYVMDLPTTSPRMGDFTISVASSKSLSARWWSKTQLTSSSKLTIDRYGMLSGEFSSPVEIPLTECLLAHGEKLYRVGPLAAGQRVQMTELAPLDLEARLTQRRVEQTKDVSTPWEQDSVDIPRIMQMVMFHEAARGTNYTGLTHRYQPRLDLSTHVRLGRAVLVGRAKEPVARLFDSPESKPPIDDENHWTWYRVVLPVQHN
jgi:hypothetical protein